MTNHQEVLVPAAPVLDCHAHVAPRDLLDEVAAGRGADGVAAAPRGEGAWVVELPGAPAKQVRPPMVEPATRRQRLAAQGIDAQLLSPWLDLQPTAAMHATSARSWARRLNDSLAHAAENDGLGALATVALDDVDAAARDLADAVSGGLSGLVLSTDPAHCTSLADPRLAPLWEAAESLAVPVLLHPATDGPARALPDSAELGNALCRLVDTTFAVTRLLLSGVLDRHPRLRLVTVHGGGFLPYQAGRVDGAHRGEALASYELERSAPSEYLPTLWFDTVALAPAAVRFLVETVGAGRVLLGTDYPFPIGGADPVGAVRAAGLDADSEERVLGANLTDLLSRQKDEVLHA